MRSARGFLATVLRQVVVEAVWVGILARAHDDLPR